MRLRAALLLLVVGCGGAPVVVAPPPPPVTFPVGVPVFGRNNYVEYIPGDLAVIISVPHGGVMTPTEIPDRTVGTTATDLNTIDLGREIAAALMTRTGRTAYLIVSHLKRTKLDPNREVVEGAAGNAAAITAWGEFQAFVDTATRAAVARHGFAVYIDLHGHGHPVARLELGYLLSAATLNLGDAQLNAGYLAGSSLRTLPPLQRPFAEILRGETSLGGMLAARGFPAVPSPAMPSPGIDPYFDGGYNTSRHTLNQVVGLQIEGHYAGVRDSEANRRAFAAALAAALDEWVQLHVRRSW
ncbi:MAG: hypothetical protein KA267_08000 [Gemmatimonadales bacterium]|nr:hypothetical protein [Gemmatimonadales bacterium]MBP6571251.1 hypothetical protein [Gemmatimonadales bacterium]MBP7621140.1 hypothetical protein [Gemmatimonadales bacterium]